MMEQDPTLRLTAAGFTILPDGTPLLAVVETRTERSWFRKRESNSTETYLLKAGSWWGKAGPVPLHDPRHVQLCQLAMQEQLKKSLDGAVGL